MKNFANFRKLTIYVGIFIISFVLFLLMMFPYNVIKETLLSEVEKSTGIVLSAEELSPAFLMGAQLENASIKLPGGEKAINLRNIKVTFNPFYLFLGKIHIALKVLDPKDGQMTSAINLGLISLLQGTVEISRASLVLEKFEVQSLIDLIFDHLSKGGGNPLLGSLFEEISVTGKLDSDISFSIDSGSPEKSSGNIELKISEAQLNFRSKDFGIEDQKFTKAKIIGKMTNGRLEINPTSGFLTNDLDISMSGKFQLAKMMSESQLEMEIKIKLLEALKEKFGFLIDGITQKNTGGEITMQLRGPVNMISFTTL